MKSSRNGSHFQTNSVTTKSNNSKQIRPTFYNSSTSMAASPIRNIDEEDLIERKITNKIESNFVPINVINRSKNKLPSIKVSKERRKELERLQHLYLQDKPLKKPLKHGLVQPEVLILKRRKVSAENQKETQKLIPKRRRSSENIPSTDLSHTLRSFKNLRSSKSLCIVDQPFELATQLRAFERSLSYAKNPKEYDFLAFKGRKNSKKLSRAVTFGKTETEEDKVKELIKKKQALLRMSNFNFELEPKESEEDSSALIIEDNEDDIVNLATNEVLNTDQQTVMNFEVDELNKLESKSFELKKRESNNSTANLIGSRWNNDEMNNYQSAIISDELYLMCMSKIEKIKYDILHEDNWEPVTPKNEYKVGTVAKYENYKTKMKNYLGDVYEFQKKFENIDPNLYLINNLRSKAIASHKDSLVIGLRKKLTKAIYKEKNKESFTKKIKMMLGSKLKIKVEVGSLNMPTFGPYLSKNFVSEGFNEHLQLRFFDDKEAEQEQTFNQPNNSSCLIESNKRKLRKTNRQRTRSLEKKIKVFDSVWDFDDLNSNFLDRKFQEKEGIMMTSSSDDSDWHRKRFVSFDAS